MKPVGSVVRLGGALSPPAPGICFDVRHNPHGVLVQDLVRVARRDNPLRSHLLVSPVLARHLPTSAACADASGALLAMAVRNALDPAAAIVHPLDRRALVDPVIAAAQLMACPRFPDLPAVVVGFAETATALGHVVAHHLGVESYLHTTRAASEPSAIEFREVHSHAPAHQITTRAARLLDCEAAVVLVDDELTTGRTALALIEAIHANRAHPAYVVAVLTDWRGGRDRDEFDAVARRLGSPITVAALLGGDHELGSEPVSVRPDQKSRVATSGRMPVPERMSFGWPLDHGRMGWSRVADAEARVSIAEWADQLRGRVQGGMVLCLGVEEYVYPAILLAASLDRFGAHSVVQATTRSPIIVGAHHAYPIHRVDNVVGALDDSIPSFVYNLPERSYDHIIVLCDPVMPLHAADDLGVAVAHGARESVVVVSAHRS